MKEEIKILKMQCKPVVPPVKAILRRKILVSEERNK